MKKIIFLLTLVCGVVLGDEYAQVRANVENGFCKASDFEVLDRLCQAGNGDACNDMQFAHKRYRSSTPMTELSNNIDRKFCFIDKNQQKRLFYAELGCKFNNLESCGAAGYIYHMKKDHCKGAYYDEIACNGGHIFYCSNLGVNYDHGDCGYPIDKNKALSLYKKACKVGNEGACKNYKIVKNEMRNK